MPATDQDFAFFQAGVVELQDYLLSGELYWQLSVPDVLIPRLSIGLLLLTRRRLEARADSLVGLASLDAKMEAICCRWHSAWERKAGREIHARLDLWRNYLLDYQEAPARQADAYPHEVRWRVILEMLAGESPDAPDLTALNGLDATLELHFQPGDFIWETSLISVFPKEPFWFLFGRLKPQEKK